MVATPAMLPRSNPPKRAGGDSYEEFHPYGTTAWVADGIATVSLKRYKFTGMERDDETGLQCHGVRYYAPWLGRWTSADPIGLGDGVNRFGYVQGRPIRSADPTGMAELPGVTMLKAQADPVLQGAMDSAEGWRGEWAVKVGVEGGEDVFVGHPFHKTMRAGEIRLELFHQYNSLAAAVGEDPLNNLDEVSMSP